MRTSGSYALSALRRVRARIRTAPAVSRPIEALLFFKQKTAYEISTRDWSSDVCLPIYIKITKNTLKNAAPQLYGDFGVVTSVGDWIGTFDSKPFSQECIVVDTWRKIENQWKVVRRTSHCYTEDSVYGRVSWIF